MKNSNYKYRKEINGFRALAILPIIFYDSGINLFWGSYEEMLYISHL